MGEDTSKIKAKKRNTLKDRKRNTLAGGEFGGVNKQQTRLYFMAAVQKECPECLKNLHNTVFSEYYSCNYSESVFDWADVLENPYHKPLKIALIDWGKKYHIAEPWVFDVALDTLKNWNYWRSINDIDTGIEVCSICSRPKNFPAMEETQPAKKHKCRFYWCFKDLRYYISEHAKVYSKEEQEYMRQISEEVVFKKVFSVKGWNRFKTSRKNYEELVKAELEKYLNELEDEAYTQDLPRTAEIRKAYHFNWLVLYQVKGLSVSDITIMNQLNGENTHESTVRKAIKKTATWVGLDLRKE